MNKPKAIGTAAETAVLRAILPYFPKAKRVTLHGASDRGDIDAGDDATFIFEVKGGKQTSTIGDKLLALWMGQTDTERDNAGKSWGILVTQRAGVGAPNALRWWAHVHLGDLAHWTGGEFRVGDPMFVRLELGHLLELLAAHGYTVDVPEEEPDAAA